MKKRYFLFIFIALFCAITECKALEINGCNVMLTIKETSSKDTEKYICKNKKYGDKNDSIYYSGKGSVIYLNSFNAYYVSNEIEGLVFNVTGNNTINYLHITNNKMIEVTGKGSLKFKDNSYVKKYKDGKPVYYFTYKNKVIVDKDNNKYEGTLDEFISNYEILCKNNKLPKEFKESDYELNQVMDYDKITSLAITKSWISSNIKTKLKASISNGYGLIEYKEPNNELVKDDVILISKDKVDAKYELSVDNIKNDDIAEKVVSDIDDNHLVSFYNVSITDDVNNTSIKSGNFTIKMKINDDFKDYDDYQIIYVDDDGNIKEYIASHIEDGYIVFNTNHLSYYGVIGTQKDNLSFTIYGSNEMDTELFLKLIFLLSVVVALGTLVVVLLVKGNFIHLKKKRRKRTLFSK